MFGEMAPLEGEGLPVFLAMSWVYRAGSEWVRGLLAFWRAMSGRPARKPAVSLALAYTRGRPERKPS